eukprot:CAMPEP_0172542868 /NCGR_PEP_ID=MMETSP1067-20121228/13390_1 /TAXON_ID=265564 ORGANISM="Thalassiosira punctigera, Strain Tpunct2005C2" /NCGR_SAMPLE_ID=MMETSP1067 /ASSEMBLY_ACC=CAM_ASM_000444 /LENGTH=101 /DNA_ID=CAMNT_0013329171 /DNA_START=13 /DNA_END=314 /DNA_ORIENTATION=+
MNSTPIELTYQLSRLDVESAGSGGSDASSSFPQQFELDCSQFDSMSQTPSCASSTSNHSNSTFNSLASDHRSGGLSRSRCVQNLSAMCDASSVGSERSTTR